MGVRRYDRNDYMAGGQMLATPEWLYRIQHNVKAGRIRTEVIILSEGERLDHVAAKAYGNGRLWWIISAASGIGWALQPPPGTRLLVPVNLSDIAMLVS